VTRENTDPVPEPTREHLPSALTIFLTANQRRRVTRALRAIHRDRAAALLTALGLERLIEDTTNT